MGFCRFWWVLVQIRWADDRGGRSGGKSVISEMTVSEASLVKTEGRLTKPYDLRLIID